MPTFNYKCTDCGTKYEVFHKSFSATEALSCPSCESSSAKKMVTASNFTGFSNSNCQMPSQGASPCASGTCPYN
ncbi:MAG: zinc ribbon domain-containing protein [Candidatus Kapabacteria bacterium]|nr:zinc ribbon domain-containing protein [Candidatus Kapabacteria bacterium]